MVRGSAEPYDRETMSDLQCPVRIFLTGPRDEEGVRRLAATLAQERIAAVLSDDRTAASRTAEQLAAALGVSWTVRAGLRDLVGSTGRVPALDEIADLHRGEAVVVVGGSLGEAILALEGDADGWSDRVWPGQNSRSVGSSIPRSAS